MEHIDPQKNDHSQYIVGFQSAAQRKNQTTNYDLPTTTYHLPTSLPQPRSPFSLTPLIE